MILQEETYFKYGYYPYALPPHSSKKVLAACDGCGKVRSVLNSQYRALCMPCSLKGKIVSDTTKQKMSKAKKGRTHTDEAKRKMSEFLIGKIGDKSHAWKGGKEKRICKVCGKTFFVKHYKVKNKEGNYCSRSCSTKSRTGEEASAWQGGISFEPYCIKFNNRYKRKIREQFGNKCFLCGKSEEDNNRLLDVHHVNYNKACGCDNTVCICVPLCRSCHSQTGGNRVYWQEAIMRKLKSTLLWW